LDGVGRNSGKGEKEFAKQRVREIKGGERKQKWSLAGVGLEDGKKKGKFQGTGGNETGSDTPKETRGGGQKPRGGSLENQRLGGRRKQTKSEGKKIAGPQSAVGVEKT